MKLKVERGDFKITKSHRQNKDLIALIFSKIQRAKSQN